MKRGVAALVVVALITLALALLVQRRRAAELEAIDRPATIDALHLDIPGLDPPAWVERLDPQRACPGYTLVLFQRRVPMLIDLRGRIVHLWPRVRVMGRARLAPDGRLLVIGTDDLIKEYDWQGRLLWFYRLPAGDTPHHDVSWTAAGDVLVLGERDSDHGDSIQVVNHRGRVVWRWRAADHLDDDLPAGERRSKDPTHVNSVQELPPNRFFEAGDARFRPGNLLVSARNLDTVFILDRESGRVVWRYGNGLDRQHEAVMIPRGRVGDGLVLVFDNGLRNRHAYRSSSVLAIDPTTDAVVWRYAAEYFYSSVAGSEQPLPNGNLLVSSSQGGRVFEITPRGELVWQWTPPFAPMRAERYPYDYCPQLAARSRPRDTAIPSRLGRPFIDRELRQLAVVGEFNVRLVAGARRMVLNPGVRCRTLVIPPQPRIYLGYGLDEGRLRHDRMTASFRFVLRPLSGGPEEVLEDTVSSDSGNLWRDRWLPLATAPFERAELCVEVTTTGTVAPDRRRRVVAIDNPRIESAQAQMPRALPERALSPQEQAVRSKQLRVLGYIN